MNVVKGFVGRGMTMEKDKRQEIGVQSKQNIHFLNVKGQAKQIVITKIDIFDSLICNLFLSSRNVYLEAMQPKV